MKFVKLVKASKDWEVEKINENDWVIKSPDGTYKNSNGKDYHFKTKEDALEELDYLRAEHKFDKKSYKYPRIEKEGDIYHVLYAEGTKSKQFDNKKDAESFKKSLEAKLKIKSTEYKKEDVKEELQTILDKIEQEKDLYMSEVVYLQDHQDDIKRLFPNEPRLWQWADIPEEEYNKSIGASKKSIKSGESYGWYVDSSEAWDKLQLWIDTVGAEAALDDIALAMGTDELSECLAFIFRNNDFKEGCSDYEEEVDE